MRCVQSAELIAEIAEAVLDYLKERPEAADTAEGITQWWLHDKYPLARVKEALEELFSQELLSVVQRGGSQTVYRGRAAGEQP